MVVDFKFVKILEKISQTTNLEMPVNTLDLNHIFGICMYPIIVTNHVTKVTVV